MQAEDFFCFLKTFFPSLLMKPVLPKINSFFFLFSFLKPWADNGSTNEYLCQLFYGLEQHPLQHPISKMHIVGGGPGETSSAFRCLFYLINS